MHMRSSYLPFHRNAPEAKKLMEAIRLINEVQDSLYGDIGGDEKLDNSPTDSGYIRQLSIASRLIEDCLQKETKEQPQDKLIEDIKVLVLRLMGEDESTFAPETREVMKRWRDKIRTWQHP